jgi:glycosyltransferase involved in cell wall biosynthesis
MIRADLHLHSRHSKHPGEWVLQRLGAQESYTDVEAVYRACKARGCAFITLTDHNTIDGALELAALHPKDCFVSTEATAYFPEDGCKIHILCYGITAAQFEAIQKARENIYNLRDYLRLEGIACSVAHGTFDVNGRLTVEHLEKLILLFNTFESANGTRGESGNRLWTEVLRSLTPETIRTLVAKHGIDPWGEEPWRKGLTGGSDDHAGLFLGETYTLAEADSVESLLEAIRGRRTLAGGRLGDHKALAYAVYKIASEYTHAKGGVRGLPGMLSSILFQSEGPALRERMAIKRLGFRRSARDQMMAQFLKRLMEVAKVGPTRGADWQVEQAYDALATLVDACIRELVQSVQRGLSGGEAPDLFQQIATVIPAAVFSAPFFSTLRMLNQNRTIHAELVDRFKLAGAGCPVRTLWFSDTVSDLNGVSVTLREVAACAARMNRPLGVVGCLTDEEQALRPAGLINLPCVCSFTPQFYDAHTVRIPSLLRAIDIVAACNPSKIIVSTPGPVGLVGLLVGRLLGIPCVGVYHTDFTKQAELITDDLGVAGMVESYLRWFYARMDEIRVPTQAYIDKLAERGYPRAQMRMLRRGLDCGFSTVADATLAEAQRLWFPAGGPPVLLYAGRVGREKNLDLLFYVCRELKARRVAVRVVIAGDGPDLAALREQYGSDAGVTFTGRLDRELLKACYASADLFLFPSTSDTFGMAVLEAQALGLPALVTDVGGPQEIIRHGKTGYVLPADDAELWVRSAMRIIESRTAHPEDFGRWRAEIRETSSSLYSWEALVEEMIAPESKRTAQRETAVRDQKTGRRHAPEPSPLVFSS